MFLRICNSWKKYIFLKCVSNVYLKKMTIKCLKINKSKKHAFKIKKNKNV